MFLSRRAIENCLSIGDITIENYEAKCLKTASYVLRMSNVVNRITPHQAMREPVDTLDLSQAREEISMEICEDPILHPGEFILVASLEELSLTKRIGAMISPLSHIARLGIDFLGAMYIRPGFSADTTTPIVFEIVNHGAISLKLHAGMPLCHTLFFEIKDTELDAGDSAGRTDVRSGNLFSRYDLNPVYQSVVSEYRDQMKRERRQDEPSH